MSNRYGMRKWVAAAFVAGVWLVPVGEAIAGGGKQFPLDATYKEECGSCHLAFPPQLLAPASWREIMAGLARHFGTDASVDPAKARALAGYLDANAGRSERFAAAGNLHVSRTPWFGKEHRNGHDGLTAAIWSSPAVKSPANCGACHQGAEGGDFSERNIRLPR